MSFSGNVKKELSEINIFSNTDVMKYELYGYMLTITRIGEVVRFKTANQYNVNRLNKLLGRLGIESDLGMKGKIYEVMFPNNEIINEIAEMEKPETEETKKAMIRGIFMGSGSLSEPESRYHLEIGVNEIKMRSMIYQTIREFGIKCRQFDRNNKFCIYIKDSEEISKFLALIGANKAVLKYEDIRVIKETKNDINRKVNCETANIEKTVKASVRQVQAIKELIRTNNYDKLPYRLREIAQLRLAYPNATLEEIGEMTEDKLRKAGVHHRMKQIMELAKEASNVDEI